MTVGLAIQWHIKEWFVLLKFKEWGNEQYDNRENYWVHELKNGYEGKELDTGIETQIWSYSVS